MPAQYTCEVQIDSVSRTCNSETADVLSQLDLWQQKMTVLISENSEEFVPAARKFMETFDWLHRQCNRSELVSALHNFGGPAGEQCMALLFT